MADDDDAEIRVYVYSNPYNIYINNMYVHLAFGFHFF